MIRSAAPGPAPMKCTVMALCLVAGERAGDRPDRRCAARRAERSALPRGQRRRLRDRRHADQRQHAPRTASRARAEAASSSAGATARKSQRRAKPRRRRFPASSRLRVERRQKSIAASGRRPRCERRVDEPRRSPRRVAPLRQPMPADDHGFTHTHCVTGIAGRQPVLPPTLSARAIGDARRARRRARLGARSARPRSRASPH